MGIDINFKFPQLDKKLKENMREIYGVIAATMQTNRAMIFDNEGAYNGRSRWANLKFRNGQILSDRGTLAQSMGPNNNGIVPGRGPSSILRNNGDMVTIGTNLKYAQLMNDGTTKLPGGVLRPVKAKALKIPIPMGKNLKESAKGIAKEANATKRKYKSKDQRFIFRKSVKIPERRFDDWTQQDQEEVEEAVANFLNERISQWLSE